jgi:hypothetical protein
MEAYASNMAQRGVKDRRRLKPGDRLADGSIWTGETLTTNLVLQRQRLVQQIADLQAKVEELDGRLGLLLNEEDGEPVKELSLPGITKRSSQGKKGKKPATTNDVVEVADVATSDPVEPDEPEFSSPIKVS